MAAEIAFEPFPLTPLDRASPEVYTDCFMIFDLENPLDGIPTLQRGIDRLVSEFPFIAGEIDSGHVKCPSPAVSSIPMLLVKHHPHTTSPPGGWDKSHSPLPRFIPSTEPRPVLRFQANVMSNGIVLCLSFSHAVLDGTGAGTLLEALAACCRESPADELPTDVGTEKRSRDNLFDATLPHDRRKDHDAEYTIEPLAFEMPVDISTRRLIFSSESVRTLKDTCTALLREQGIDTVQLSSNDVFTAFLAVCISQAQNALKRHPKESDIVMAVNLRNKLQPAIPDSYLGNMVTVMRTEFNPRLCHCAEIDDERKSRIAELAFKIRTRLTSFDDEHVRSLVSYIKDQNDWSMVNMKFSGMMSITSWRHLNVCALDFGPGLGRIGFDVPTVGAPDGLCILMPRQAKAGSGGLHNAPWDIYLSLDSPVMDTLMKDPFFSAVLEPAEV
ncbi:putative acetyltransferase [Aspergillus clavatus NRRL 1]|uniref:Acetyltransferase, putative n=1 Tax=Aspergillus clavatus (strain ATCC 1007 / CBS 513.65 / DSM 816 / NCTC 3887 / NRRL 1 / QM 1276 / 107) TaxID=344612 RepID=A1C4G8_ASPCL|nr:acetyltransferase, putative [Aspergillus clavatus NRRL 1]EAW15308.1 acetyltransferase, putative [Aspergillus clavatus NRRL 1]